MVTRVVRTKEELKLAKKDDVDQIIVEGKLAKTLREAKKVTTLSAAALGVLTVALAAGTVAAPVTGGTSLGITAVAATPVMLATGISVQAIILISVLGVGFVVALFKEYKVEINKKPNGEIQLVFTK